MIKYLSSIGKIVFSIPAIFISAIVVIYCIILVCFVSLPIVIFALLTLLFAKIKYFLTNKKGAATLDKGVGVFMND